MSKPGKVLKRLCKRLKVRLTVKRNGKRVYKSIKVLKAQCKRKTSKKKLSRGSKYGKNKKKKKSLKNKIKKYGITMGLSGIVIAGGIGSEIYVKRLYIKVLSHEIKLEDIKSKSLKKYFNQKFVSQKFIMEQFVKLQNQKGLVLLDPKDKTYFIKKTPEQEEFIKDIQNFEQKMSIKRKKIEDKLNKSGISQPEIIHDIQDFKCYKNYLEFVMKHCKLIGFNSIRAFLNKLREKMFSRSNKNILKDRLDERQSVESGFGTIRMVPVKFKDVQLGGNYIVTKKDGETVKTITGKLMHYQGPNYHLNYDNNAQPGERPYIYVVSFDNRLGNTHHRIFVDKIVKIAEIDFLNLPKVLVKKIKGYY